LYVWDLRLIRQRLKELGLDWEWPDFPPVDTDVKAVKPRRVEVDLGDLGKSGPILTPDQKARRAIERYRKELATNPDNPPACTELAWVDAPGPEPLRDVKAALPLAEKAAKAEPNNAVYRNTLGVVYYRAGKYREAVEVLRPNLARQEDWALS